MESGNPTYTGYTFLLKFFIWFWLIQLFLILFRCLKGFPLISSLEATRRAKSLLMFTGCNSTLSNNELLTCAQKLDYNTILNGIYGVNR